MFDVSDFNDLDIFSVVATEGSLRRAAARLGLSQPVVSQRLTRLEKDLGSKLVVRSTSGIQLTDAGERLVPYIRGVVRLMNEALATVRATTTAGAFAICTNATLAPIVVPFAFRALRGLPVTLSNRILPTADAIRSVADGDVDAAFGQREVTFEGLSAERLFEDELCVVVADDHPLAGRDALRVEDLVDHPVVVVTDCPEGQLARDHLIVNGVPDHRLRAVQPATTALALAMTGGCVAITLRSSVLHAVGRVGLVELELHDLPSWRIEVDLVFRTVDEGRPPVRLLREAVHQARESEHIVRHPPGPWRSG